MRGTRVPSGAFLALLAVLMAALPTGGPAPARGDDAAATGHGALVIPPTSGLTRELYSVLSALWWNWAVIEPEATNPLTDDTGADGHRHQFGPVWFLAGTLGGRADRTVTVPAGRFLFFPISNAAFWAPEDGDDEAEVRQLARAAIDAVNTVECRIDGRPVPNLNRHRVASPAFPLLIRPGSLLNEFGYDPGLRFPAVSDGYWVLVQPLPRGRHTISFRGMSGGGFETAVNYVLNVR